MPLLRDCARCGDRDEDDGHDYCSDCRREKQAAQQQARDDARGQRVYQTSAWRKKRTAIIRQRGARCEEKGCGITDAQHRARHGRGLDVNHLDGDELNWADSNLRVQCRKCHNAYDARRRRRIASARIVAVVGMPGTGKSVLLDALHERSGMPVHRIDDYRRRHPDDAWTHLVRTLKLTDHDVLVESNAVPPGYQRLLRDRRSTLVELRCDPAERERRLRCRGEKPARVAQLVRSKPLNVRARIVLDTTDVMPQDAANDLAHRLAAVTGRSFEGSARVEPRGVVF